MKRCTQCNVGGAKLISFAECSIRRVQPNPFVINNPSNISRNVRNTYEGKTDDWHDASKHPTFLKVKVNSNFKYFFLFILSCNFNLKCESDIDNYSNKKWTLTKYFMVDSLDYSYGSLNIYQAMTPQ